MQWTDRGKDIHTAPGARGKNYRIDPGEDVNGKPDWVCRHGEEFVGFAADAASAKALAEEYDTRITRADAWEQYMRNNDPPKDH